MINSFGGFGRSSNVFQQNTAFLHRYSLWHMNDNFYSSAHRINAMQDAGDLQTFLSLALAFYLPALLDAIKPTIAIKPTC